MTVTVPNDSLAERYPEFREGAEATITPENAEIFLRSRDTGVSQSAITRMERQQAFLDAFGNAAAADPSKVTKLYEDLMPYLVTSISNDWFVKLMEALSTGRDRGALDDSGRGRGGRTVRRIPCGQRRPVSEDSGDIL